MAGLDPAISFFIVLREPISALLIKRSPSARSPDEVCPNQSANNAEDSFA